MARRAEPPLVVRERAFRPSLESPLHISANVYVLNLSDVDVVKGTVTIRAELHLQWQLMEKEYEEFLMVVEKGSPGAGKGWEPQYRPTPFFLNAVAVDMNLMEFPVGPYRVTKDETTEMMLCTAVHIVDITASQTFQVHNFPFDVQYIKLFLQVRDEVLWGKHCEVLFNHDNCNTVFNNATAMVPSFHVVSTATWLAGTPDFRQAFFVIRVQRNTMYYMRNIVMTQALISGLGCLAFWMEDKGDKVGILSNLILAVVAFKFIVNELLPIVAHATLMDWYSHASLLHLGAMTVICCIVPESETTYSYDEGADNTIPWVAMLFWVGTQILFIYVGMCKQQKEKKKLDLVEDGLPWADKCGGYEEVSFRRGVQERTQHPVTLTSDRVAPVLS